MLYLSVMCCVVVTQLLYVPCHAVYIKFLYLAFRGWILMYDLAFGNIPHKISKVFRCFDKHCKSQLDSAPLLCFIQSRDLPLTARCQINIRAPDFLHRKGINPEDGDQNVSRNAGTASAFHKAEVYQYLFLYNYYELHARLVVYSYMYRSCMSTSGCNRPVCILMNVF